MSADFCDAAERHREDAEHLFNDNRLANADHLFGLSAECALKAVMLGLKMNLTSSGKPEDPYAVHIDKLWTKFITFANNRNGAHYVSLLPGIGNPFDDWNVEQRYDHRSNITSIVVEKHRQAATETKRVLDTAILNGEVT